MNERGLLLTLMGVLLAIFGVVLYGYGLTFGVISGADAWVYWPGLFWVLGGFLAGTGLLMNFGQRLPKAARALVGIEVLNAGSGMAFGLALIMLVTDNTVIQSPTGQPIFIKEYAYRLEGIVYFLTAGFVPLLAAWGLATRRRTSWISAFAYSLVELPIIWFGLAPHFEYYVAVYMTLVQIVIFALLSIPTTRGFYEKLGPVLPALRT